MRTLDFKNYVQSITTEKILDEIDKRDGFMGSMYSSINLGIGEMAKFIIDDIQSTLIGKYFLEIKNSKTPPPDILSTLLLKNKNREKHESEFDIEQKILDDAIRMFINESLKHIKGISIAKILH